jgi:hypothetical protein
MQMRRIPLLVLIGAAVLVATAGGSPQPAATLAAKKKPARTDLSASKDLWATINVCDTATHPNTIGIRGSMPGLGDRVSALQMRFQVQYMAKADGLWHNTDESADSGWKKLGRTRTKVIESGQDFTFLPPTDGGAHTLRGSVRYKWLRKGHPVLRMRRFTEAGHKSTAGADPDGYSAAVCQITQP